MDRYGVSSRQRRRHAKMRKRRGIDLAVLVPMLSVAMAGLLIAAVPQTITVDGANDFLADNLVDADGGDTEFAPLDIDSVFITNDTNKLYIGFGYDKDGWTTNQLGIAISTGGPGGTTDPWGHAIAWTGAPHKPDYHAYCDMDNSWQELREWNDTGSSWDLIYSGTSSLGWINNTGFEEVGFALSDLGLAAGDTVYIEIISTQSGGTKGPLDLVAGDADQLSTPSGTTFDVASPVELDTMVMYVLLSTADTTPPVVESVRADGVTAQSQGAVSTDRLYVRFSEPVDEATAENASNYALAGHSALIDSVVRNVSFPDRVALYLDTAFAPQSAFISVEVTGVEDLAGNPIVDDNTTNVGCMFYKGVLFRGLMGLHLRQHSFSPSVDTFTVEGSLGPLTFGGCDNAFMADQGDSTYNAWVSFSIAGSDCASTPVADTTLQWKFMHQCTEYEPLAGNRAYLLSSETGAWDTLEYWWNDQDANEFTAHPIDVIFTVDASMMSPTVDSVVAINGSAPPLTFDIPSLNPMDDDGVYPDAAAGDAVYSILVRFPTFSPKNLGYKYVYNGAYECQGQGNRDIFLNDAVFDTVGGALGELVMPLQYFDRCGVTGRDVEVVFTVNTRWVKPGPSDTIAVNGEPVANSPGVIDWSIPSINPMADDGAYPDATAGDGVYSSSIVFPDSSDFYREYKYLFNSTYECTTQANRSFFLDDTYDAAGNPQVLDLAYFNTCWVDAGEGTPSIPFKLRQNYPNPFNPVTTVSFTVPERGRAALSIYNVKGELVRTLIDRVVDAGEVRVTWDGTDRFGRQLASGVYFYRLRAGDLEMSRKMILLR